jgi:hypothetical protein
LKKKFLSQKIHISAHRGGRNITKIIFWLILSHCGSKLCIKCVKSLLKIVNFFQKSWKNKHYLQFWNVGKVGKNNTQSRDILKYVLSKFWLKNSPCKLQILEFWFFQSILFHWYFSQWQITNKMNEMNDECSYKILHNFW